jgi:hypothetical protein
MPNKPRDYDEELRRLIDSLAESILESPDEDFVNMEADERNKKGTRAEEVRKVLLEGVKRVGQERLRSAEQQYQRRLAEIRAKRHAIPATREGRRRLLERALSRERDVREAVLTLQHRDFSALTDSDIDSLLVDLLELGVLDASRDSDRDGS